MTQLTLYTQPACPFCDTMKSMLDEIKADYKIVNIREDAEALEFVRQRGHRTVPLLYYNEKQINVLNTNKYNTKSLQEAINRVVWPSVDSGIEQGI